MPDRGDWFEAARPEISAWLLSLETLWEAERQWREACTVAAAELVIMEAQLGS